MKKMLTRKPFSRMEGLTLLETMFALAVGALVLIGAVIFYMSTKQNANASKSVGDMNAIVAGYQSYIAGGNAAPSGTTGLALVQDAGFLPKPLNDAWGIAYKVELSATTGLLNIGIPGIALADINCKAITNMVGTSATAATVTGAPCAFAYPL